MSAGERLAEYVHESQFDGFPTVVIERAKELILDSVGCALGATQTDIGRSYINLAMDLAGKAESTVAGSGMRISALHAAYVNTQLANLLDFDDTYDVYHPGHPGCLIVQSALAMAEAIGATGEELLTSVILGYEVSLRVGHAVG
jgi:2-methylcitrate dehydratase PrpD